ncbi:lipid-binding protein [Flavobacterium sp.]|uniref:lipid-binding protein n=1 Tax=Flavobacterium sp. TaxID=239 RepID=UPI004033D76E
MMKLRNKIAFIALSFGMLTFTACEEDGYGDYDAGGTATQAMNGEWYITITDEASGEVQVENALHKTYDSNGRLFITDRLGTGFTGWWLESALDADLSNLTFTATDEMNFADESAVTITEGKIIKNGGRSTSGVVVDSIYFKAVFDYEPTQTLIYAGHKRTGFEEDEH